MSISQKQKYAVDVAIAANPTVVEIVRTEYQEADGARTKTVTSIPPQTFLLFPANASSSRVGSGDNASPKGDVSAWGALAPSTANVMWGAFVTDVLTVDGLGSFEIVSGRPLMVGTDINGYQLVLKRVS